MPYVNIALDSFGIVIVLIIISVFLYQNRYNFVEIEDNYFAVISSGSGERIVNTYLYFENGEYSYIKTVDMTKFWGSSEWETKIIDVGKFNNESGTIETCLARGNSQHEKIFVVPFGQGRLAITNYKVLEYSKGFSYVEYELKTGRTHQIRVHSAHLNHPIVGDKLYGRKGEKFNLSGQLLHAYKLIFVHPVIKQKMEFCAEIPDYFEDFLKNHF